MSTCTEELFPRENGTFVQDFDISKITGSCRHVPEMNASVAKSGVLMPIIIGKLPNGEYQVMDGQSRVSATRSNNKKSIPAIVFSNILGSSAYTMITNLCRSRNPSSEYAAYKKLSQENTFNDAELATELGISKQRLVMFSLLDKKLVSETRNLFASGKISLEQAKIVSKLPSSTQKRLVRDGDLSTKNLRKELTDHGSVSKAVNVLPDTLFNKPPELEAALKQCLVLAEDSGDKSSAKALMRIISKLSGGMS